jgi:hypothetical protein
MKKAYVVRGSEDGVLGVADSARKAVTMALNYVNKCAGSGPASWPTVKARARVMRRDLRGDSFTYVSAAGLRGLVTMSDNLSANVEAFVVNRVGDQEF